MRDGGEEGGAGMCQNRGGIGTLMIGKSSLQADRHRPPHPSPPLPEPKTGIDG